MRSRVTLGQVATCFVIFSGDIAYSGKVAEYQHATDMITELMVKLKTLGVPVYLDFVPGNHDCNFKDEMQVRSILLDSLDVNNLKDDSVFTYCTSVQENFFSFVSKINGDSFDKTARLVRRKEYDLDGQAVIFQLLNSAWVSRIKEQQGKILFPTGLLDDVNSQGRNPALVISVIHHPYNWYSQENARLLKNSLEKASDLILSPSGKSRLACERCVG